MPKKLRWLRSPSGSDGKPWKNWRRSRSRIRCWPGNEIEAWAAQLERTSQVLSMDAACFREYARLMHRRSDTLAEDAMIAATARVHGLTVATRNERNFAHFDVAVLNPFRHRAP
jgi:hypothetical protein